MPSKIRSLFKRTDNVSEPEINVKDSARPYDAPLNDASTTSSEENVSEEPDSAIKNPQPILKNGSATLLPKRFGKNCAIKSRDGVPIITSSGADDFSPSLVQGNTVAQGNKAKEKRTKNRPSAKTSAFGGAPRYDWMDIETAAAVKVQSVYRRNKVLKYLEANDLSTPGMRNRRRKRMAKLSKNHSEDVPFPFNMCGVGFIFGDGTLEDDSYTNSLEKKKKSKKREEAEKCEAEKRRFWMRKKSSQHLEEGIEVVDSFDEAEETPEC